MTKLARHRITTHAVLLCLIILGGAALRLYALGAESYYLDEIHMLHSAKIGLRSLLDEGQWDGPAYVVMAHFWLRVFGASEFAARLLSASAGIACVALAYTLGRGLFGKGVGLASALLMAVTEFQIYYSQEFRCYNAFELVALLSFALYVRALKTADRRYFVANALARILLVATHAFGVFVLVAQDLHFILRWNTHRRSRTAWLLSQSLTLLVVVPGLLPLLRWIPAIVASRDMTWRVLPTSTDLLRTLYWYVFPLRRGRPWLAQAINWFAGLAFLAVGTWLSVLRKGRTQWLAALRQQMAVVCDCSDKVDELLLVGCWFLCPLLLPFILSYAVTPMYVSRYTISAAPALYLLLAFAMTKVRAVLPELVILGSLAILIAPGLQHYYVTPVKAQWRELAAYVQEKAMPGDGILLAPDEEGWQSKSFRWYYHGDLPTCSMDSRLRSEEAMMGAFVTCTADSQRIWLIMNGSSERVEQFREFLLEGEHGFAQVALGHKFLGLSVYLLTVAPGS